MQKKMGVPLIQDDIEIVPGFVEVETPIYKIRDRLSYINVDTWIELGKGGGDFLPPIHRVDGKVIMKPYDWDS